MNIFGEYVAAPDAVRTAEKKLFRDGVSEDALIERAAGKLASAVKAAANREEKIIVVAGGGNNGCDGLECVRILKADGYDVSVFSASGKKNSGNAARLQKLSGLGVPFLTCVQKGLYKVAVDCVFGIGLSRAPLGDEERAIKEINESGAYIISADVPSGLDAYSGHAPGVCVRADETVTFTAVKCGLIMGEGRNFTGEIKVADVGVNCIPVGRILSAADAVLPKRKPVSHKGVYGRVRVVGGCDVMPGAPLMCFESALAASRAGAGFATLCVPESEKAAYSSRVKETMLNFLPAENGRIKFDKSALDAVMSGADAVAVGCGMGRGGDAFKIIEYLINNFDGTLIIDADGLNAAAEKPSVLSEHRGGLILTPHVAEFDRLCPDDGTPYLERIRYFAARYRLNLAVKSATTVITDGREMYFNVTGTPALAKGGSGDVLAGMTAAFACVMPDFDAVKAACYHFGLAGERASARLDSVTSVLASDVIIDIASAR